MNLCKWKRSLFARLRCGVLSIELEKGRFSHTPVEHRICKLCQSDVKTEFHLLFECKTNALIAEREKLFEKVPELKTVDNAQHMKY